MPAAQRDLSVSYEKVGDVLMAQGNLAAALASYQDSLAIKDRLAKADPSNAGRERDLFVAYDKVGEVLVEQGNLAEAQKFFHDSLAIAERLTTADPSNAGWQRDLAISHGRIAELLAEQDDTAQALSEYRQAREIIARLAALSPDDATLPNDLAVFDEEIAKLEQSDAATRENRTAGATRSTRSIGSRPWPSPSAFKYRAFISYSHADTSWAKWLHRALEGFTIDKDLVGPRDGDRHDPQGAPPHLPRPRRLHRGPYAHRPDARRARCLAALIVICSPAAAKSHYVNEEIRLFKSRHPDRPVVPLIVAGKPGDAELECFPPALKFKLDAKGRISKRKVELLAADAREEGDGKQLALAKVVAGLLGVSSDDIFRRAERERRRKGRVRNAIIATLAILAVAATGSAVYAWQQLKTNEAFLTATLKTRDRDRRHGGGSGREIRRAAHRDARPPHQGRGSVRQHGRAWPPDARAPLPEGLDADPIRAQLRGARRHGQVERARASGARDLRRPRGGEPRGDPLSERSLGRRERDRRCPDGARQSRRGA